MSIIFFSGYGTTETAEMLIQQGLDDIADRTPGEQIAYLLVDRARLMDDVETEQARCYVSTPDGALSAQQLYATLLREKRGGVQDDGGYGLSSTERGPAGWGDGPGGAGIRGNNDPVNRKTSGGLGALSDGGSINGLTKQGKGLPTWGDGGSNGMHDDFSLDVTRGHINPDSSFSPIRRESGLDSVRGGDNEGVNIFCIHFLSLCIWFILISLVQIV